MLSTRKISYILITLLIVAGIFLHIGPVILAGLFSYMILDMTYRIFLKRAPASHARWLALLVFILVALGLSWIFARFVKQTISTIPHIAANAIPKLINLSESYGMELPFENVNELRDLVITEIKDNAQAITKASRLLTMGFFHILVAVFVAVFCFMDKTPRPERNNLFNDLCLELTARIKTFMLSFERVLGASVTSSAVNTALTAIFLLSLSIPNAEFLIAAAFILGIIPVIGNVMVNALIVGAALIMSPGHAALALIFLLVIHKVGYALNSRMIGSRINLPMWQVLVGILLGEVMMGLAGIILAPAILHYIKEELESRRSETFHSH